MASAPAALHDAQEERLGVGDIVRLNSDTVRMMVRAVDGDKVTCRWHDGDLDLLSEEFDPRELVREHLIAHGGDCIRRGKALLNLYATRVSGAAKMAKAL